MAKLKHLELPNGSNYDIYGVNVQEISYDDYQALTPEQKNSDIAYCITDTPYEVDDSIYGEASGTIASFNNGSANPLKSLEIDINPIQDLHGYDKPWADGAGKNKFQTTLTTTTVSDVTFTVNNDGTITTSGTPSANISTVIFGEITLPAGSYKANGNAVGSASSLRMIVYNVTDSSLIGSVYDGNEVSFTLSESKQVRLYPIILQEYGSVNGITFKPMIRLSTETDATFAPYTNICPISGRSSVEVTVVDDTTEPTTEETYEISLGQTVYGGKLNVTTGELTVDRAIIDLGSINWSYNSGGQVFGSNQFLPRVKTNGRLLCEQYDWNSAPNITPSSLSDGQISASPFLNRNTVMIKDSRYTDAAAFKTAVSGITLCYELETPTTVTLTPTQVSSLLGNNNIWSDTGKSKAVYITSDFIYNELRMNDTVIASNGFAYHSIESESATMAGHANTASNAQTVNGHTVNSDVPSNATFTDTTYTFANGTNGFTVTPSGGTAQTVTVTPSITNNVTGSGTSGYLAKFNGSNTITNGAQLGSDTTKFLRNDGEWAVPPGAGGGVTGVKGNAESTYRTGNVNLTPANLGLESKSAASGGTDLSLVTTGEKAVWDEKPSTDTKNTAGSTDTSSKIYLVGATSQAANPQTYSQDTAYVGTDGCLYSGGTKVEVVSNNAGYHNSIYRGKSLGTSITTAQWNAISAGTFDDMYIGDYWTLSTAIGSTTSNIQYVIAGFDYWWNCGDSYPQSSNKHHVVLVPATNLYSAQMNATSITTGGYIGSAMYTTNLANARTGISTLFGNHLYSVRRLFTNSVNTVGQATGWAWATSSVDLMSETMVYGHPVWTTSGFEVGVDRTILPLFALNPASASIYSSWWLRSVATPSNFAYVSVYGNAASYNASTTHGVRPAFAIY